MSNESAGFGCQLTANGRQSGDIPHLGRLPQALGRLPGQLRRQCPRRFLSGGRRHRPGGRHQRPGRFQRAAQCFPEGLVGRVHFPGRGRVGRAGVLDEFFQRHGPRLKVLGRQVAGHPLDGVHQAVSMLKVSGIQGAANVRRRIRILRGEIHQQLAVKRPVAH